MHMHTSIFKLNFCGISGKVGFSVGGCCMYQYKPESDQYEMVWQTLVGDDFSQGRKSTAVADAFRAVSLGLERCKDLHDTSICLCSDNADALAKTRLGNALIEQLSAARNRISYCLIAPEANKDAVNIVKSSIREQLGTSQGLSSWEHDDEAVDYDDEDALVGDDEALARSMLRAYAHDPALLSLKEMKDGWGGCLDFMLAHGLKPWNAEDVEEALTKSRELKAGPVTLANAEAEEDEEADMPPLEHLEPLGDVTDEAAADMPALEPLEEVPLSMRSMR
jgi:hypothetical protein